MKCFRKRFIDRKFSLTLIFASLILFPADAAFAQDDLEGRVQFQQKAKPKSSNIPRPATRPRTPAKTNRVSVQANERPRENTSNPTKKTAPIKLSNLVVSTEVNADVLLKPATAGAKQITRKVSEKGTVEFENIRPGKYTVTVSSEGFYPTETEVIIIAQKTIPIKLELESIKYQLNIETNVNLGEVRYAPARLLGKNSDGSLKTTETGGYCIVPIKNGKAVINDLQKGYYNLDIRPAEVEYEPVLTAISTDILDQPGDSDQPQVYRIDLEKKISTGTFSGSAWANDDWISPAGWKLQNRSMKTNGISGFALPRNEQYRYYQNFEMISDVRLTDGNKVGFLLRYVNAQNYYLVEISGAKAAEPYNISGFIVKNGKSERIVTNPNPLPGAVASNKSFRVLIRAQDNVFRTFIVDSDTGEERPLGDIVDRDINLRKGAVGIAARENSNFEVGSFTVCTPLCR